MVGAPAVTGNIVMLAASDQTTGQTVRESEEEIYCNLEMLLCFESGKASSNMPEISEISEESLEQAVVIKKTTQGSFTFVSRAGK